MKKNVLNLSLLLVALAFVACQPQDEISLAGKWFVSLTESTKKDTLLIPNRGLGPTQNVMYAPTILDSNAKREGEITLPSTLDEAGFGNKVKEPFLGCLSRKYQFIGEATYTRTFRTNETCDWELKLERVMWKSTVKIDGKEIGSQESLATPHRFVIKNLEKGKHTIEITVDNTMIHRLGEKGHAYGEHMQTIWNGILGDILLSKITPDEISEVRVHAPFSAEKVEVAFKTKSAQENYTILLKNKQGKTVVDSEASLRSEGDFLIASVALDSVSIATWDEFSPNLYELSLLVNGKVLYQKNIGFRSFKREGNQLFMNGKPLFLRGNLDNCHFPLTGYPSLKKEDWMRIFQISKDNGCNHIRFHSYCPPEAAFEAADELGLMLAPEAGVWIDGWMPGQITALGRGNAELDSFIQTELEKILLNYGSHASCCMMAIGNELGNSDFEIMRQWMIDLNNLSMCGFEEADNYKNRLFSISTARSIANTDDYYVTHHYPNVGETRQWMFPYTKWNYEENYSRATVPTIAHEIGQWPVYPDWNEVKKYTGVLVPSNLEQLKKHAQENGVLKFNKEFYFASGMQNKMMYKDEIESFMRTPSCRGIHLLGIQDYSGQGEALIGFLDSFYDEKGFWSSEEVLGCFSSMISLAEFEKYGWKNSETLEVDLLVRNMQDSYDSLNVLYEWKNRAGKLLLKGSTRFFASNVGDLTKLGKIEFDLNNLHNERITLTTIVEDKNGKQLSKPNSWSFWVFDEVCQSKLPNNVVITNNFDEAIAALNLGQNVILDASALGKEGKVLKGDWGAVYWSTTWFPGQSMQTLGLWLDKKQPIFDKFACDGYGDWIWWNICKNGRIFDLELFPDDYVPMAMPVPDFHNNQRLGTIFEVAVRRGKLLVSGYNLQGETIEQEVYKNALIEYVSSDKFNPKTQISPLILDELFNPIQKEKVEKPEEFANALLYVECAKKLTTETKRSWKQEYDLQDSDSRVSYSASNLLAVNKNGISYWEATETAEVQINTPAGELGLLHVVFAENNGKISGSVEGRAFSLPKADGEKTQTFNIDREDCLDGKLSLKLSAEKGKYIAIKQIVFIPVKK